MNGRPLRTLTHALHALQLIHMPYAVSNDSHYFSSWGSDRNIVSDETDLGGAATEVAAVAVATALGVRTVMVTVVGAATETAVGGSAMGVAAKFFSMRAEIEMVASLGNVADVIESVSAAAVEAVVEARIELMRPTLEWAHAAAVEAVNRVATVGCFDGFFPMTWIFW